MLAKTPPGFRFAIKAHKSLTHDTTGSDPGRAAIFQEGLAPLVDAIPGLEIEADDVRCTHGATAGRVDREQVFYCMARGLSEFEAMHVIVQGFLQIVSDRIPVELVRETLNQAVEKKLGIG